MEQTKKKPTRGRPRGPEKIKVGWQLNVENVIYTRRIAAALGKGVQKFLDDELELVIEKYRHLLD